MMLNSFGVVPNMDRASLSGASRRDSSQNIRASSSNALLRDSNSRHRSRSPSTMSSKGHLKIHCQSYVVLVHPPETQLEVLGEGIVQQQAQPQEDTLVDGRLEIIMDKPRIAKAIRVELVVACRLQIPGETVWQDKEIFHRMVEIGNSENEADGIRLEKGSQSFEFTIIVPATLATYDRHPLGRITQTIRATVEGFPQITAHHSSLNLFSGIGFGKQRDRSRAGSRSRNQSRASSRPGSRATSPVRLPRNGSTSHFRTDLFENNHHHNAGSSSLHTSPLPTPSLDGLPESGDIAFPLPTSQEIKSLKGQLYAERLLIVAANPSSNYGEGLTGLNMQKSGRLAGVGDWKLSLTSDAFSVGSYVTQRLLFLSPSPFATIFAVRLLLNQTYRVTDLDSFDPNMTPAQLAELRWVPCPKRSFLVSMDGVIPHVKRPDRVTTALWRGSLVGQGNGKSIPESEIPFEPDFKLKTGRKRLPDDTKARPSTIEGTITPIRVHHELVLQVFFSVDGEDLHGNPLEGDDRSGVMRMLVLTLPTVLPSCTCTFERVTLPEYSEVQQPQEAIQAGACACGNTMDDFARRESVNDEDEDDDDVDRLDVDGLMLDDRGRSRARNAGRRKAEYDGTTAPREEE